MKKMTDAQYEAEKREQIANERRRVAVSDKWDALARRAARRKGEGK